LEGERGKRERRERKGKVEAETRSLELGDAKLDWEIEIER
jgi:hypothetical protein